MQERPKMLMWVKGHSEVEGNEEADRTARRTVRRGRKTQGTVIATPAGIKQEFPVYPNSGSRSHKMVSDGSEGAGIYDYGQGTPAAMVLGDWKMRGALVRV